MNDPLHRLCVQKYPRSNALNCAKLKTRESIATLGRIAIPRNETASEIGNRGTVTSRFSMSTTMTSATVWAWSGRRGSNSRPSAWEGSRAKPVDVTKPLKTRAGQPFRTTSPLPTTTLFFVRFHPFAGRLPGDLGSITEEVLSCAEGVFCWARRGLRTSHLPDGEAIIRRMHEKGNGFLAAAIFLRQKGRHDDVALHLIGQALENLGKAALLRDDFSLFPKKLQKKYGHDLERLVRRVLIVRADLRSRFSEDADLAAEIAKLNRLYRDHALRYASLADLLIDSSSIATRHTLLFLAALSGMRWVEPALCVNNRVTQTGR